MIFSALRALKKYKGSPRLHAITVIESERLPFSVGQGISLILQRDYVDARQDIRSDALEKSHLVISRPKTFSPEGKRETQKAGRILDVESLLENWDFDDELVQTPQFRAEVLSRALKKLAREVRLSV